MKNQYFGDVGDYGKYGLLRFLAKQGLSIAVNWYLTPNDESNDGSKRGYLKDGHYRACDPELFDVLREMCNQQEKDVCHFGQRGMIPGAIYYSKMVEPQSGRTNLPVVLRRAARKRWHQKALEACAGPVLVFMDPDNGLKSGMPSAGKNACKYVYASEVCDYYDRGQDVVYYCHKGRRKDVQWEKAKGILRKCRPEAAMLGVTYHRGTQRSYLFMVHPQKELCYRAMLERFLKTQWGAHFTEECFKPDEQEDQT